MSAITLPEMPSDVAAVFSAYPPLAGQRLREIRQLIFRVADDAGAAPLTETLKWREPAYLTNATRTGTTIRLGWRDGAMPDWALYVHCGTDLVDRFRALPGSDLRFEGNRAVLGALDRPLPEGPLAACTRMALRYHADKKAAAHG